MIINFKSKKERSKQWNSEHCKYLGLQIAKYQLEKNEELKDEIYNRTICPIFENLIQDLVHVYRFNPKCKKKCLYLLHESCIHRFSTKSGANAFSYVNVVAKSYLIMLHRKMKENS